MRSYKVRHVRLTLRCTWLVFAFLAAVVSAEGQQGGAQSGSRANSQTEHARLRAQLAETSREYKSSLELLLTRYEGEASRAEERWAKMNELCTQGLTKLQDVESAAETLERSKKRVSETKSQLSGAEVELADALIEVNREVAPLTATPSRAPRTIGSLVRNTAYIRYGGGRSWSLSEAGAIKQFFVLRFGRALPIHVFGQSALHDRWGYDHRNAMDIGLNPDGIEGQALMDYLRGNGVPFTAFHYALPGVATGPHIHVGLPSHRIMSTVAGR